MKLNLLPKHVAKSQGSKAAFFIALIIAAAGAAGLFFLKTSGQQQLADAREPIDGLRAEVAVVMGNSAMADTVIAEMTNIDRNIKLTQAMTEHNRKHVDLYRELMSYVPAYYRLTSISSTPTGPDGVTVSLNGVLKTHQQYADLVLALYRMPGVTNVTRAGFALTDPVVPALNEQDQIGSPVRPGEGNLPSDPDERMAMLIQRASQNTGFLGVNNFGTDNPFKGAMPDWSTVAVTVTITGRPMQPPNPRATLLQGGTGGAPGGTPAGFPGGGGGPAAGGGGPTVPGGRG